MLAAAFLLGGVSPMLTGWLSQKLSLGPALSVTSGFYLAAAALLAADALLFFRKGAMRLKTAMEEVGQ